MKTKSAITTHLLRVTAQKFTSHNSKPKGGQGFINLHFDDNRKECLCDPAESVCWQASLTVKAFSGTGDRPNPENDILLMEASASVEGHFVLADSAPADGIESLAWYFDEVCKQKLLSKMRLLLLDTEFSNLPLPGSI